MQSFKVPIRAGRLQICFFENWFQPVNWSLIRLTAQERTLENGKTPVERQRSHGTHQTSSCCASQEHAEVPARAFLRARQESSRISYRRRRRPKPAVEGFAASERPAAVPHQPAIHA